jgi:hypothetical protein
VETLNIVLWEKTLIFGEKHRDLGDQAAGRRETMFHGAHHCFLLSNIVKRQGKLL